MNSTDDVPTTEQLINPTLKALHKLGGSATIYELVDEIISEMNLQPTVTNMTHGDRSQTEVEYRAAWARTYLKYAGLVENSKRAVWVLTARGRETQKMNSRQLVRDVRHHMREQRNARENSSDKNNTESIDATSENIDWHNQLLQVLYDIEPEAFERLCQRLLRESGFIEVEVTGRSGDGGIDGHGVVRIAELISFTVIFQSKRYRSNIGPEIVRDFRGAMVGRADKGLLITTAGFTRDARKEATRDGAPPIDLIDGELLVEKLKDLEMGVRTEMVERVEIEQDWFRTI